MTVPLEKRLQIKPDSILHILNVPDDVKPWLGLLLINTRVEFTLAEHMSALLIFIRNRDELEKSAFPVLSKLDEKCLLWLAYPKGTSGVATDINRDILWKLLAVKGWRPARMVALDDIWSCMRFSHKQPES